MCLHFVVTFHMKIHIQLFGLTGTFQIVIDSVLLRNCQSIVLVFHHLLIQLRGRAPLDNLRIDKVRFSANILKVTNEWHKYEMIEIFQYSIVPDSDWLNFLSVALWIQKFTNKFISYLQTSLQHYKDNTTLEKYHDCFMMHVMIYSIHINHFEKLANN